MKIIKQLPLAFYILFCYLFLSGYFAYERILNTDNSYYFFNILNTQNFWFAEHRIGVIPSQIPLLLFAHFGASLHTLIYVYSLSFPLEYLVLAIICQYYLQVKEATLTLALVLITGIAFSFFHPVTETYHALAYAVLVYAALVSKQFQNKPVLYYFCIFSALCLCLIAHPIGAFAIGFVALFSFVTKQVKLAPFLFIGVLAAIVVLVRLVYTSAQSYDIKQYDNFFASITTSAEWATLAPVVFLKTKLTTVYLSTLLMILSFSVIAIRSNKTTLLFISVFCAFSFAAISIFTFSKGDLDMMMEKTFMPSIFMLLLPFCYLLNTLTNTPRLYLQWTALFMSLLGFVQIINASYIATQRLQVLESIAKQPLHPKLIAEIGDFNESSLHFNHWNTVIDSYIIAKCKLNKEFTLFLTTNKQTFQFDSTDTNLFLGPPWAPYWNKKMLNKTYFVLPNVGYRQYETK